MHGHHLEREVIPIIIIINDRCIRLVDLHLFYSLLSLLILGLRSNSTKMVTTRRHDKLRIETLLSPTEENGGLPFLHLPPLETPNINGITNNATLIHQQDTTRANKLPSTFFPFTCLSSFLLFKKHAKAKRKRASPWQIRILEQVFDQTAFPTSSLRAELGFELGMTSRSIQIWFQNKRQAVRKSIRHKAELYPE